MYLASALPALLVTILIFMDQQITAVIVNRKEHKLKVGAQFKDKTRAVARIWEKKLVTQNMFFKC